MPMEFASTPPVNVSRNPGVSINPAIAVLRGSLEGRLIPWPVGDDTLPTLQITPPSVYVVWSDNSGTLHYNIFFSMSHDGGQSFSAPRNLSNNLGWSDFPQIAVSGNNIYVAWFWYTAIGGGNAEILFARSIDKGVTFSAPINFSNNSADSRPARLAISGDNVYVVWNDAYLAAPSNISFRRSADAGATFGPTMTLGNNGWFYSDPQIAVNGNDVYVVWNDRNGDISFCRSTDGGTSFSPPRNLSNNLANSWYPMLAVSGNNVYVAWYDIAPGIQHNVSFTRSSDKGNSFSTPIYMSSKNARSIDMKASAANVYLVWDESAATGRQIFLARSTNNGRSFQVPVNLSGGARDNTAPLLEVDGDDIYVSWTFVTGSVQGMVTHDILLTGSGDAGATFSSLTNLTLTPNNRSADVRIVALDQVAYIAWSEGSLTDSDILFSTGVLYESVPPAPSLDPSRVRRPPDLPYKVDLYLPQPTLPPPPGPPPPVKRSLRRKSKKR